MERKYCQSCAMPLGETDGMYGTNADCSKNEDYCKYCFEKGAFTSNLTMEEVIEQSAPHMAAAHPGMGVEKAKEIMRGVFPKLKRWSRGRKHCQSCARPLGETGEMCGTNADGSKNEDYCKCCFEKGAFTSNLTMEEVIEQSAPRMAAAHPGMSVEKAKEIMRGFFPKLKRWNKGRKRCQSCARPMGETGEMCGTNADGSKNEDYCKCCFEKGAFTSNLTMEEAIEKSAPHMAAAHPGMSVEKAKEIMRGFFPSLERWKEG